MVKYPTARASALINTMELALGDTQSQDRTLVLGPLPIFESAIIPIALRMREYDLRAGASKARQQELEDYIREFNNFPVMPNTKKLEKSKDGFELVAIFDEDPGFKILANRMRPHAWAQNDCILFLIDYWWTRRLFCWQKDDVQDRLEKFVAEKVTAAFERFAVQRMAISTQQEDNPRWAEGVVEELRESRSWI